MAERPLFEQQYVAPPGFYKMVSPPSSWAGCGRPVDSSPPSEICALSMCGTKSRASGSAGPRQTGGSRQMGHAFSFFFLGHWMAAGRGVDEIYEASTGRTRFFARPRQCQQGGPLAQEGAGGGRRTPHSKKAPKTPPSLFYLLFILVIETQRTRTSPAPPASKRHAAGVSGQWQFGSGLPRGSWMLGSFQVDRRDRRQPRPSPGWRRSDLTGAGVADVA